MPAMADDFYDGLRAYDSGDYKTALRIFKPLADELGHAEAEYRLGWWKSRKRASHALD